MDTQTFRSPTALVVWVVWLLFAAGNWIDLAVQGRDHLSLVAAAVLLMATGVAYVTAQRPRIIADDAGVTVRNPLRDHRIGWRGVAKVDLVDLLRVHCAWGGPPGAAPEDREHHKVVMSWAVHHSRRRQLATQARARRAATRRSGWGFAAAGDQASYGVARPRDPGSAAEAEAEKIVQLLNARVTAARAEDVWAGGTAQAGTAQAGTAQAGTAQAGTAQAGTAQAAEPQPAGAQAAGAQAAGAQPGDSPGSSATAVTAVGPPEPLASSWSGRALAALAIPALILLVVVLL